jgi:XTP/dITP diphosphohydrolase
MPRATLVFATRNPGKVQELTSLLATVPVNVRSLESFPGAPPVPEDGQTYLTNAAAKALAIARFTGLPSLADDSGLEVDALDGGPGVRSARFAGPLATDGENVRLLLQRLAGVPPAGRGARFRCVLVAARPDGATVAAEGACEGVIIDAPRGAAGFGYDPVFLYLPAGLTFAEMTTVEKRAVSHRGRAIARLAPQLPSFLALDPASVR